MKFLRKIFAFLGSVRFAVFLISLTALMVVIGTLVESKTDSHQFAAQIIYSSWLFQLLLAGFFINILFSALRRWPFKKKHIPFLITHFGLLMIIAGTAIKTAFGTQGHLLITEGSGGSQLLLPGTYALYKESRNSKRGFFTPLKTDFSGKLFSDEFPISDFTTHVQEKFSSWIQGQEGKILGLEPFKAVVWKEGDLLLSGNPLALITDNKETVLREYLSDNVSVLISDTKTEQPLGFFALKELINGKEVLGQSIRAELKADFDSPALIFNETHVPLSGPLALINQTKATYLGQAPLTFDLKCDPNLIILQDSNKNSTLITCDAYGRLSFEHFSSQDLNKYLSYDEGFGGYTVQAEVPNFKKTQGRKETEEALLEKTVLEFKNALEEEPDLAPPLVIFKEAALQKGSFTELLLGFLKAWDRQGGWLYSGKVPEHLSEVIQTLDWASVDPALTKSCLWASRFFSEIEPEMKKGGNIAEILQQRGWPLMSSLLQTSDGYEQLTLFTRQLFAAGNELPWLPFPQEPEELARLFSAYLRAYEIHYSAIPLPKELERAPTITLESPLVKEFTAIPASLKLEENIPKITLQITKNEEISLAYDKLGNGLKWPAMKGQLLLRFQPHVISLPYHVRVHGAQQINYPDSEQPFSYESEVTIMDKRSGKSVRKTLSMNNVHETYDAYRFYLSGLSENKEGIHTVQIVVNRDPAKYWLTYPGGVVLAMGILALFWLNPYKPK